MVIVMTVILPISHYTTEINTFKIHPIWQAVSFFQIRSPSQQLPTDQTAEYVHQVSDIHTPKSRTVHSDFNLQMSPTKVACGICYSPLKRLKLKEFEDKKIPVIVDNVQPSVAQYRATEQEYTVKKKSKITPSVVNYSFSETFSQTAFILDQRAEISDYQTIKNVAKVISQGDESSKQTMMKDQANHLFTFIPVELGILVLLQLVELFLST